MKRRHAFWFAVCFGIGVMIAILVGWELGKRGYL